MAEIQGIKKDFEFLKNDKRIQAVLLFGSKIGASSNKRSDIDVCVVAPKQKPSVILKTVFRKLDTESKRYDICVFEELPLYLKEEVIEDHKIIFSRDKYKLYEYFYFYRKLWKEQEHRNRMSAKEIMETI